VGPITLLPLRTAVKGPLEQVTLTLAEWQLMVALVLSEGVVMSRSALAGEAWGRAFAGRHSEVEVYISRLRRKLARAGTPDLIRTVRGEGYRLDLGPGDGSIGDSEAVPSTIGR
jgi:DNA-binding response OmpR family regulator